MLVNVLLSAGHHDLCMSPEADVKRTRMVGPARIAIGAVACRPDR